MVSTSRRFKQLRYLLTSAAFTNESDVKKRVLERYSSEVEVDHYANVADVGLFWDEEAVVSHYLSQVTRRPLRTLVVGCGGGREAFALEKAGLEVVGIDYSKEMIEAAKRNAHTRGKSIEFVTTSLEEYKSPAGSFDFVFLTSAIAGHLRGQEKRVAFYSAASRLVKNDGAVFTSPEIRPLEFKSPFFWASQILRWRLGRQWEKGDSARSFIGRHNKDEKLVFYHFYPSEEQFLLEVRAAGLTPAFHAEGSYILRLLGSA